MSTGKNISFIKLPTYLEILLLFHVIDVHVHLHVIYINVYVLPFYKCDLSIGRL